MMLKVSECDLFEFFGSDPVEAVKNDGYFCYAYSSQSAKLYFSYDIHQESIQIRWVSVGFGSLVLCQEGAKEISLDKDVHGNYLVCGFDLLGEYSVLKLRLRPEVDVIWSNIRRY
jgi:hypothetical protein